MCIRDSLCAISRRRLGSRPSSHCSFQMCAHPSSRPHAQHDRLQCSGLSTSMTACSVPQAQPPA
eukprot:5330618-Alexandrium_andersonii.AAC.1